MDMSVLTSDVTLRGPVEAFAAPDRGVGIWASVFGNDAKKIGEFYAAAFNDQCRKKRT